jgi:hypothetical protein
MDSDSPLIDQRRLVDASPTVNPPARVDISGENSRKRSREYIGPWSNRRKSYRNLTKIRGLKPEIRNNRQIETPIFDANSNRHPCAQLQV